jgi:SET domain-containing protein
LDKQRVILRQCSVGRGVFALCDMAVGEEILVFSGPLVNKEVLPVPHTPENDYYLQIDDGLFLGPSGELDDYVNHSCEPNSGIVVAGVEVRLVAIRPIAAGEQVCFDYSTAMDDYPWEMACRCGAHSCRGAIGDFVRLPMELQERYVTRGVVPTYILRKLKGTPVA